MLYSILFIFFFSSLQAMEQPTVVAEWERRQNFAETPFECGLRQGLEKYLPLDVYKITMAYMREWHPMYHIEDVGSVFVKSLYKSALYVSPELLAIGTSSGTIETYRVATGERINKTQTYSAPIDVIAHSPAAHMLISASLSNGKIRIWNTGTYKQEKTLEGTTATGTTALLSGYSNPYFFISSSRSSTIRLWNSAYEKPLCALPTTKEVCSLAYYDEEHFISNGLNIPVKIWNIERQQEIRSFTVKDRQLGGVVVNLDSECYAFLCYNMINIGDKKSHTGICSLIGHKGWITHLIAHNDLLISVGHDKQIKVWDWRNRKCIESIPVDTKVCGLAGGIASRSFASIHRDSQSVTVWQYGCQSYK